jgi:hypothetical protein
LFFPFNKDFVKIFKIEVFHGNQVICENYKWASIGCMRRHLSPL